MVDTPKVADLLAKEGISAGVVNARFIKPLDKEALEAASHQVKLLVTLEENAGWRLRGRGAGF